MSSNNSLDKDKAVKSLDKLFEIFKDISFNADEVFKKRCPYKNAKARCCLLYTSPSPRDVSSSRMPSSA